MEALSGEFETCPWVDIVDWGRAVKVASVDDIAAVHRLVAAPGEDRRAVIFEWQTKTRQRGLVNAIEAGGLALRPFDETDQVAPRRRTSLI